MKDRISTHPGRVKLVPVEGESNTFDLIRADGPVEEGTALNKTTLLRDMTASLYGLGGDAVPDDVFLILALGTGSKGYSFHVELENGMPVEGATISGVTAFGGGTLVTDANGEGLGVSSAASVSVTVRSPLVDIANKTLSISPSGTITKVTVILERSVSQEAAFTFSTVLEFSPLVKTFDLCAVGGGGGGGGSSTFYSSNDLYSGGGGGGGGYTANSLNVDANKYRMLKVQVGSGGAGGASAKDGSRLDGASGGNGGTTSVEANGVKLLSAAGGGGGGAKCMSSSVGGSGNGNGGKGKARADEDTFDTNGKSGSGKKFGEGTVVFGGGGAGGAQKDSKTDRGKGGMPNGGDGALIESTYAEVVFSAEAGSSPGGGGGGGCGRSSSGASGGRGILYLRWHYE